MEQEIGIRKNIQSLSKNERQQYFWCLKMLGILPPFEAMKERYFYSLADSGNPTEDFYKIAPTCLHDELIANHSTCCEHHSLFFGYYHRHLMFHFEMRINYVDECLRLSHKQFETKFPQLWALDSQRWKRVMDEYVRIAPVKTKVMAHYWNPTNYNNRDDLCVPVQIADPQYFPEHKLDEVDELFNLARGSYPYEINVSTRWFTNQEEFQKHRSELIKKFSLFFGYFKPEFDYSDAQKNILAGNPNPRQHQKPKDGEKDQFFSQLKNLITNNNNANTLVIGSRNFKQFNSGTKDKMSLLCQKEGESLVNYGGRFDAKGTQFNFQYFKSSEVDAGSYKHSQERVYSRTTPHYLLGLALYEKQDFIPYLTTYTDGRSWIESSHDVMHDNLRFCMNNSTFSITNLMFFPYHSWIDVQLEMKIRMCDTPIQGKAMFEKLSKNIQKQRFDPILDPHDKRKQLGEYPLIEWCDPRFGRMERSLSFAQKIEKCKELNLTPNSLKTYFNAHGFYLKNSLELRKTYQLKEFYDQNYKHQNIDNYKEFKGFASYDAGYDYEIFETLYDEKNKTLKNVTYPLGNYPSVNIPEYLKAMKEQVLNMNSSLVKNIKTSSLLMDANPQTVKYYIKLAIKSMILLIRYRSSIANGTYIFTACLEHLVTLLLERKYELSEGEVEFLRGDINLFVLPIFGREEASKACLNCGEWRYKMVNMNIELYDRFDRLMLMVNRLLLREVLYDSEVPKEEKEEQHLDLHKLINISFKEEEFKMSYIQGAEQVIFDVSYGAQHPQQFELKISLDTKRIQNDEINSAISRRIDGDDLVKIGKDLTYKFDFYNMIDMHSSLEREDLDGLVYDSVTVNLLVDGESENFSFKIKHYHEIVHYKMLIGKEHNKLKVTVIDADYKVKKEIFRA